MEARNRLGILTTLLKTVVKILLHVIKKKTPIFIFADLKKIVGRKLNAHKHRHNMNVYYYAYALFSPRWTLVCKRATCSVGRVVLHLNFASGIPVFFKFIYTTLTTNRWGMGDLSSQRRGLFLQKTFVRAHNAGHQSAVWETFAKKYSAAPNNLYGALFSLYFFKKKNLDRKTYTCKWLVPRATVNTEPGSSYLI